MPLFDWSDMPATKKDLLTHLAVMSLIVWLLDSDGKELKALRSKAAALIAGKSEESA